MDLQQKIKLMKANFAVVEEKHAEFFRQGTPRWPGEKQNYLRNHHHNLDNFSLHRFDFEKLGCQGLPETIVEDLRSAFDAAQKGELYTI